MIEDSRMPAFASQYAEALSRLDQSNSLEEWGGGRLETTNDYIV
jgi:hypothetical protein